MGDDGGDNDNDQWYFDTMDQDEIIDEVGLHISLSLLS